MEIIVPIVQYRVALRGRLFVGFVDGVERIRVQIAAAAAATVIRRMLLPWFAESGLLLP